MRRPTIRIENWPRDLREVSDIRDALMAALSAAEPETILKRALKVEGSTLRAGPRAFQLSKFDRIIVIGGGKAAGGMAAGLAKVLGDKVTAGIVNIPDSLPPLPRCSRIELHRATHPIPGPEGIEGVKMMLELVGKPMRSDLVICLLSGGGSALLPMPAKGLRLPEIQKVTKLLLKSGAEIHEINVVRKHLSEIAGGRLAERLYPAQVLSLIISDVVGDDLDSIASGPTAPDPSTYRGALAVLAKYNLVGEVPASVRKTLDDGMLGRIEETPKANSKVFGRVHNLVVGSNELSCRAAADLFRRRGYATTILTTRIQGEASEAGKRFSGLLVEMRERSSLSRPACIIAGGETTVTVRGRGIGGRNQELALYVALGIAGLDGVHFASMGTDGLDGGSNAAGAIVDGRVIERALRRGLDADSYVGRNDSHAFFKKVGGLIMTGATGTNVNDIMIAVASGLGRARRRPESVVQRPVEAFANESTK
jgi:glycerate 2-kinase